MEDEHVGTKERGPPLETDKEVEEHRVRRGERWQKSRKEDEWSGHRREGGLDC